MIIYTDNAKEVTKRLLELTSEFSRASRYKFNIENSIVVLCTHKQIENEILGVYLHEHQKYLEINLTQKYKTCTLKCRKH